MSILSSSLDSVSTDLVTMKSFKLTAEHLSTLNTLKALKGKKIRQNIPLTLVSKQLAISVNGLNAKTLSSPESTNNKS